MIVKLCLLAIDGGHFSLSDALSNFVKDESECEIVSADTRWRSSSVRLMYSAMITLDGNAFSAAWCDKCYIMMKILISIIFMFYVHVFISETYLLNWIMCRKQRLQMFDISASTGVMRFKHHFVNVKHSNLIFIDNDFY